MSTWPKDFLTCTPEELYAWRTENMAWSHELRRRSNALVNSRLANEITFEDYVAKRKLTELEAAECRRRAAILASH